MSHVGRQRCSNANLLPPGKPYLLVVIIILLLVVLSPPPLQSNRELDAGLQEAVSTLLWVGPRLQSDVIELKVVSTVRT